MKIIYLISIMVSVLVLNGCRTYVGLKPLSPAPGNNRAKMYPQVTSLQPELCWQKRAGTPRDSITYDVVVWKLEVDSAYFRKREVRGEQIFFRGIQAGNKYKQGASFVINGLKENCCRLDTVLDAGCVYQWSVRYHKGKKESGWSSMVTDRYYGGGVAQFQGYNFGFITPGK